MSRADRRWKEVGEGELRTPSHERLWIVRRLREHLGRWPSQAERYAVRLLFSDEVTPEQRAEGNRLRAEGFPGFDLYAGALSRPPEPGP